MVHMIVMENSSVPEDYAVMAFERFSEKMKETPEGMGMYHVFSIIKGAREQYIFIVKDTQFAEFLFYKTLGRFAENPELSFTWTDVHELLNHDDMRQSVSAKKRE